MIAYVAQQIVNAAQVAAFYGLLAVSYVLIHAITKRINFAFGALSIWASYTLINTATAMMLAWPGSALLALAAGIAVALAHAVVAGGLIERLVVRPLVREPSLAMLVATFGVAIALEEAMRLANDSRERWLAPLHDAPIVAGSGTAAIFITPTQVWVVALAAGAAAGLWLLMRHHPFGRDWRACADDIAMAELCGLNVGRTLAATFLLASAAAGLAGALLAISYGVASFYGGFVIGLKTLFVAVIGGLGSLGGALGAALALALFETLWSSLLGPAYRDAAAFAALTALLVLRPYGLLSGAARGDRPA